MIESLGLGFIYSAIKDIINGIKRHFTYKSGEKVIDEEYVKQLRKQYETMGKDIDFR